VDAAVGALHAARGPRVAGFANALLRRLAQQPPLAAEAAARTGVPDWLRVRLERAVGPEEAEALLRAVEPGRLCIRLTSRGAPPDWIAGAETGRVSPRARLLRGAGDPHRWSGWDGGAFVVQEEGSQMVALALGARPGDRVLDACAGRGQKASLLAEQIGPSGELWATDLYPRKLQALEEEFDRLGLPRPRTAAVDWTAGPGSTPGELDRVLVDAPCTGVGTLRRRPEIALRIAESDPERLGHLGLSLLRAAATRLRAGGRLVYAVCSVLPEECETVLAGVRDMLRPVPFDAPELAPILLPGETTLRLLPRRHGTDGYFMASLTK
jgi:16S rRNA (cytosine967-C5)-methyltransferase